MEFNFKRDYERFRKSDDFVEWMEYCAINVNAESILEISILGDALVDIVKKWAEKNPYQPEIDWSKVPIDTEVYVSEASHLDEKKRHFICFLPARNQFLAFNDGKSINEAGGSVLYKYCRLVEDNPEYYKD